MALQRAEKIRHALDGDAARSEIKDFRTALLTPAVARRKFPLGARIFFDRGAIAASFSPQQAAIDHKALQYHLCVPKKPLIKRFFAYKNFIKLNA